VTHNYVKNTSRPTSPSIRVGIVGARGYSGMELVRILSRHPQVELSVCFTSDSSGKDFSPSDELLLPEGGATPLSLPIGQYTQVKEKIGHPLDAVFLATPAEVSIDLAPKFLAEGIHVIDVSGAYRLNAELYPEWYGFTHGDPANLKAAEYGLVPFTESKGPSPSSPKLIANPGCFVTSVLMALVPLFREKVISPESVVIDSKSGTTGAGKKAAESILFSEVDGECLPYKIGKHQHYPEILKAVKDVTGVEFSPFFTTQLLSARTGILSSIYATLPKGKSVYDVADAYKRAYGNYPLVRFAHAKEARAKNLLSLRKVSGTPYTNLVYETVEDKLYLYSIIDNLMKGAASQAVENLNRLYNLPVTSGLI
jgi:N-acetyl-gamma-glutamyl-phosphate reductase